jgi:hypothetical protein|tara:strand:+ start:6841 stop:7134 length:294 start_codon:yes stop_codon:yes gene_type:complete
MNAEEINHEFCALRDETQTKKITIENKEYNIYMCPIMRFPNAQKAKSAEEFFDGGHECCHVFGNTNIDATILASKIERLLNEYTTRKPDLKVIGEDA